MTDPDRQKLVAVGGLQQNDRLLADQIVVIALGPRSSTGYSLRILSVVERRRGIYVDAREKTPSLGASVTARVTYVYRLLSMPGKAKPVYVKLQGR